MRPSCELTGLLSAAASRPYANSDGIPCAQPRSSDGTSVVRQQNELGVGTTKSMLESTRSSVAGCRDYRPRDRGRRAQDPAPAQTRSRSGTSDRNQRVAEHAYPCPLDVVLSVDRPSTRGRILKVALSRREARVGPHW